MPIRIEVSDKLRFPVRLVAVDETGAERTALSMQVLARRVPLEQVRGDTERSVGEFLRDVVLDCSGVLDTDGKPVSYSPQVLDELLACDGVAAAIFHAYLAHAAPRLKN